MVLVISCLHFRLDYFFVFFIVMFFCFFGYGNVADVLKYLFHVLNYLFTFVYYLLFHLMIILFASRLLH